MYITNHSITTRKIVAGSTQNQQKIVGRGYCFGRVGPVRLQQSVVDRFLLIWSQKDFFSKINKSDCPDSYGNLTISPRLAS